MKTHNTINIGLVDDEALIVELLAEFIDQCEEFHVAFKGYSGEDLIRYAISKNTPLDIALLDLKMDGLDGVETASRLKEVLPDVKIVVMSSHYKPTFTGFMLRNKVDAFLPKGINPKKLLDILYKVNQMGYYFSPEHVEVLRHQIVANAPKPKLGEDELSEREKEVLIEICRQKTAQEIAESLFITKRTVEGHKDKLLSKTGARNSAGLIVYAIQQGLFDPNDIIF